VYRYIKAAEEPSALEESLDGLKDDFNYIMDGLDKLSRTGDDSAKAALSIALSLSDAIENHIEQVSSQILK
jgi:hypothetical protein